MVIEKIKARNIYNYTDLMTSFETNNFEYTGLVNKIVC